MWAMAPGRSWLLVWVCSTGPCSACSSWLMDAYALSGRTVDLCPDDVPYGLGIVVVPRGASGALGDAVRYGHVGLIFMPNASSPKAEDYHARITALNEKGLACDEQHLNGSTFMEPSGNPKRDLSIHRLCEWAAQNFETAAEVRAGLDAVTVVADPVSGDAHHHYVIRDASGASLVIEATDGRLTLIDDGNDGGATGFGVATNSPTFDVQLAAARQLVHSSDQPAPGGWHSVDRFQRLCLAKGALPPPTDLRSAVAQAFTLMATVSTPAGAQRGQDWVGEHTVAGLVREHRDPSLYWRTSSNQLVQRLRLAELALDQGGARRLLPLTAGAAPELPWFHDARAALRPMPRS